jgi:ribosome-associated translation inhibitor RaiA
MRITFTGKQEKLNASQERKLAMAFARLSKLLEQKGEKEAQVILTSERHLQNAEIRLNYYDHKLVGAGAATDQFTAVMDAVEKVEKQAIKNRSKWREGKRDTPVRTARTTGDAGRRGEAGKRGQQGEGEEGGQGAEALKGGAGHRQGEWQADDH